MKDVNWKKIIIRILESIFLVAIILVIGSNFDFPQATGLFLIVLWIRFVVIETNNQKVKELESEIKILKETLVAKHKNETTN